MVRIDGGGTGDLSLPRRSGGTPIRQEIEQALSDRTLSREEFQDLSRRFVGPESGRVSEGGLRSLLSHIGSSMGITSIDRQLTELAGPTAPGEEVAYEDALMDAATGGDLDQYLDNAILEGHMQAASSDEDFDTFMSDLTMRAVTPEQREQLHGLLEAVAPKHSDSIRALLRGMPSEQLEQLFDSLGALSPAQRDMFHDILSQSPASNQPLIEGLLSGQINLQQQDSQGMALVERLHEFLEQPRLPALGRQEPPVTGAQLLAETVSALSNPSGIHQGNRNVCGAASMEYMMVNENPAEFVRLAEGMTDRDGTVEMRGGLELQVPDNCVLCDTGDRRSAVDRLFQSALMDEMNLIGSDYDYPDDDGSDPFSAFVSVLGGNGAVGPGGFAQVYSEFTGRDYAEGGMALLYDDPDLGRQVQQAVLGRGERVPVAMSGFGGLHWVTVERMIQNEDGSLGVVMRNPWPGGDPGNPPPGGTDDGTMPRRSLASEGRPDLVVARYADFVDHLISPVVPADIASTARDPYAHLE